MKNIKYSTLSPASLVLAVVAYVVLVQAFGGFALMDAVSGKWVDAFDQFIFKVTKDTWSYASLDITSAITLGVPVLLLILSILFGIRALQSGNKRERMVSIVSMTISACALCIVALGFAIMQ